jgi:GGDEF domain-containing protein
MSPLDLQQVSDNQQKLEGIAQSKDSQQALKNKLSEYRQTYIGEVDQHKVALNTSMNSFTAEDARSYLETSAANLGQAVLNLAAEGASLQKKGQPAEGQKEPTLDFATLNVLKTGVGNVMKNQREELAVWRSLEQANNVFERTWDSAEKSSEKAPPLEGLSGAVAARQSTKTTLEGLKQRYDAITATATSSPTKATDSARMLRRINSVQNDINDGKALLKIQMELSNRKTEMGTIEKSLLAKKTVTPEEYQTYLNSLQNLSGQLNEQLSGLDTTKLTGHQFLGLVSEINTRHYLPASDQLTRLHVILEGRKPPEPDKPETVQEPSDAELEHQFRVFAEKSSGQLSGIDKRVGSLEKELASAQKNPAIWLNRQDYEGWMNRIQAEIAAGAAINTELLSWREQPGRAGEVDQFRNNKCQPVLTRAELLKSRAESQRETAIEKNEKEVLSGEIKKLLDELEKQWNGQAGNQKYLRIADTLKGLKEDSPEYKDLVGKQDALYTFLLRFDGKTGLLLHKPDDLDAAVVARARGMQAECQSWMTPITGDRALYQSRKAADSEPDKVVVTAAVYDEEVIAAEGGAGTVKTLVSPEKTDTYKFNDYIEFINVLDPLNRDVNGGRGWIWKNNGEKLPDQVKKHFAQRADLNVEAQKTAAEQKAAEEKKKIQKEQLLTTKGREALGKEADKYFEGSDSLAKGKIDQAMAAFAEYLKLAETFTPEQKELHAPCIQDAKKQIESNQEFPEFLQALKLQAEGKIDEAIQIFRNFLNRVNGKFPDAKDRQKYAEQTSLALEVIRQYNSDKMKMLEELSKDFIYLQTVDTARRATSKVVNPLDFAKLTGVQRELMLPYIPAGYLTPAEQKRQSNHEGGLTGSPEVTEMNAAINDLKAKIAKGDPPVNFTEEFAHIKARLAQYKEKQPGATDWQDPTTGEYVANGPSSRLLAYFDQINSSDPKVREKGFVAIAGEFKDQEAGMRYTQKYLRQAMVSRYRNYAQTETGKNLETEVRRRLATDPATTAEIDHNARELYKRWAAEQNPPLPADPVNPIIFRSFEKNIADSIFEDQFEREMRKSMTEKGQAALEEAKKLCGTRTMQTRNGPMQVSNWEYLTPDQQKEWLGKVQDGDLGIAVSEGGALKEYNWSRPYDEANAKWYKPWSYSDYNEDDYNDFKAKAAEITVQTLATLPIGWAAGGIGRAAGLGALKLMMREAVVEGVGRGISMEAAEATINALSRGGVRALLGEKILVEGVERSLWSTLSAGMKARVLLNYGAGIAVEGASMAVMNGAWEGMYSGHSELFDSLDKGKYGQAGFALLENIAKAGLFRGVGMAQGAVGEMAGANSKLLTRILAEAGGETVGGLGGAGIEGLFMMANNQGKDITWEWFASSMLQNAASSGAMKAGHSGMSFPELGFIKGSRDNTSRRMSEAEMGVTRERLSNLGIRSPADITSVRIDHATGEVFVGIAGSEQPRSIPRSELPFEKFPPELQSNLYQRDKVARESLRDTLLQTGLDNPLNWMRLDGSGNVISSTGHIASIPDPQMLPPNLRAKYQQLQNERRNGPYRAPGRVEPEAATTRLATEPEAEPQKPSTAHVEPAPVHQEATPAHVEPVAAHPQEVVPPAVESKSAAPEPLPAPRPAPELPPRRIQPEEIAHRLTEMKPEIDLVRQRERLAADPQKNAEELAKLDKEIAARAKESNLTPEQYRLKITSEERLLQNMQLLDRGEHQLYSESKIIRKPVLNPDGSPKLDVNRQPVYEPINLFEHYESKSSAYSRELLRGIDYETLKKEGGVKIIKLGGDELLVYHAGPDGQVQNLFIDISNMGPTNDAATNINGTRVNLVDIYLHRISESIIAQSRTRQGQLLDSAQFNREINQTAESLFRVDLGPDGRPLPVEEARARFDKMKTEWNLEGTFEEYRTDMQSMRILAEYRADTRYLDSSYTDREKSTFSEHITSEIQQISGMDLPALQKMIADNPETFLRLFGDRLPKSPKLKAVSPEKLMEEISKLDSRTSTPEDLMMLYALLARSEVAGLSANPALKPLADRLAQSRQEMVGEPPHARVQEPRIMDAKAVSIEIPRDLSAALTALANTDPVRAQAILAAARKFAEKPLDHLKYEKSDDFARFDITEFVEVRNGWPEIKENAREFREEVERNQRDVKLDNIVAIEDGLRTARSDLESLRQQLSEGGITKQTFDDRFRELEQRIGELDKQLRTDPDTGAYSQSYMDVELVKMFTFSGSTIEPQYRVWKSAVTELGHSGVINAKYGYQVMDHLMKEYFQTLNDGISKALPPDLQHFKIIRSGGGKFEVVFLDARAIEHLAKNGQTPESLVRQLAEGPGQEAVSRLLQASPEKLNAARSDAAVRNSQFRYNKGTPPLEVGQLITRAETDIGTVGLQRAMTNDPTATSRQLIGQIVRDSSASAQVAEVPAPLSSESPSVRPAESLAPLPDISVEEAKQLRKDISKKRNQVDEDENPQEYERLSHEWNIANSRVRLAEAISNGSSAETIQFRREELQDAVSPPTAAQLEQRRLDRLPKPKVELAANVNLNGRFIEQMGLSAQVTAAVPASPMETRIHRPDLGYGGSLQSVEGRFTYSYDLTHNSQPNSVELGISRFMVYPGIPESAGGAAYAEMLQKVREFVAQNPQYKARIDFSLKLPEANSPNTSDAHFTVSDQPTALALSRYLDTYLGEKGYPPRNDSNLGRVGAGHALIGAETTNIYGEKITHQERVQRAEEEVGKTCGNDQACRAQVFHKWRINPENLQPVFDAESYNSMPGEKAGEIPRDTGAESVEATPDYNDSVLGNYEGHSNLVPRVSGFERFANSNGRFIDYMGRAVEKASRGLRNNDFVSSSEVLDLLAHQRSRLVTDSGQPNKENIGVRRDGDSSTDILVHYENFRAEAAEMLARNGVDWENITDPLLQKAVNDNMLLRGLTRFCPIYETIPSTGERVLLTVIGDKGGGNLTWIHTGSETSRKVMRYVDELFQRTQRPDLPQTELISTVAEMHWWMAHAMPYYRGSAAISDAFTKTIFQAHGIRPGRWKVDLMPDIKAFHTPLAEYVRDYPNYFEKAGTRGENNYVERTLKLGGRIMEIGENSDSRAEEIAGLQEAVREFNGDPPHPEKDKAFQVFREVPSGILAFDENGLLGFYHNQAELPRRPVGSESSHPTIMAEDIPLMPSSQTKVTENSPPPLNAEAQPAFPPLDTRAFVRVCDQMLDQGGEVFLRWKEKLQNPAEFALAERVQAKDRQNRMTEAQTRLAGVSSPAEAMGLIEQINAEKAIFPGTSWEIIQNLPNREWAIVLDPEGQLHLFNNSTQQYNFARISMRLKENFQRWEKLSAEDRAFQIQAQCDVINELVNSGDIPSAMRDHALERVSPEIRGLILNPNSENIGAFPVDQLPGLRQVVLKLRNEGLRTERGRSREKAAVAVQLATDIEATMRAQLKNNPQISREELYRILDLDNNPRLRDADFNDLEKVKVRFIVDSLFEKAKAIRSYQERFRDNPRQLFAEVFGFEPVGEIKMGTSEFSLYFECTDYRDYKNSSSGGGGLAEALPFGASRIASLDGSIVVSRNDPEITGNPNRRPLSEIVLHEEQHNINKFVFRSLQPEYNSWPDLDLTGITDPAAQKQVIENYYRQLSKNQLILAKDEVLSFLKNGESFDSILRKFSRNGSYDYWKENTALYDDMERMGASNKVVMDAMFMESRYELDFRARMREAIEAARKINDPNLLLITDITQWHNLVSSAENKALPSTPTQSAPSQERATSPETPALPERLVSGFSDTPPPGIHPDSPGWIDQTGQIFYNTRNLNRLLAPGYTMESSPQGALIRSATNEVLTLPEYRRAVRGTPQEGTYRALMDEMSRIKPHESMHRVTSQLKDPASLFGSRGADNRLPPGKVELTSITKQPLPPTPENIDEFLSRVADGTQPINPDQRTILQDAIASEIPGFTFNRVSQVDTILLTNNAPEAFHRLDVAAMSPLPRLSPDAQRFLAIPGKRESIEKSVGETMKTQHKDYVNINPDANFSVQAKYEALSHIVAEMGYDMAYDASINQATILPRELSREARAFLEMPGRKEAIAKAISESLPQSKEQVFHISAEANISVQAKHEALRQIAAEMGYSVRFNPENNQATVYDRRTARAPENAEPRGLSPAPASAPRSVPAVKPPEAASATRIPETFPDISDRPGRRAFNNNLFNRSIEIFTAAVEKNPKIRLIDIHTGSNSASLERPIPPAEVTRTIERIRELQQKMGSERSAPDAADFYFPATGEAQLGQVTRKVYISPPFDQIPAFLDRLFVVLKDKGVKYLSPKMHTQGLVFDQAGNLIRQQQNSVCFYFLNDADFHKYLESVKEVEAQTGITLLRYPEAGDSYGQAHDAKVNFGLDMPGGQGSYDVWRGSYEVKLHQYSQEGIRQNLRGEQLRQFVAQKANEYLMTTFGRNSDSYFEIDINSATIREDIKAAYKELVVQKKLNQKVFEMHQLYEQSNPGLLAQIKAKFSSADGIFKLPFQKARSAEFYATFLAMCERIGNSQGYTMIEAGLGGIQPEIPIDPQTYEIRFPIRKIEPVADVWKKP